ncbi:MAG TPA: hypothetical protein VM143_04795 [Acidimicrobiales bacterium]|nr:hypothetical protein [Acidimicrobiales bacterium]
MKSSRHWPIVNWRGEVVAPSCKLRPSVRLSELPMADVPADVTCRRCRNSQRYLDAVAEIESREAEQAVAREQRATAALIARHRDEYEELLANEAVIDVLGG